MISIATDASLHLVQVKERHLAVFPSNFGNNKDILTNSARAITKTMLNLVFKKSSATLNSLKKLYVKNTDCSITSAYYLRKTHCHLKFIHIKITSSHGKVCTAVYKFIFITPHPVGTGSGVLFSLDFFLSFFPSFFVCLFVCFFVSKITRKRLDRFA